jgi:hypothetical protein
LRVDLTTVLAVLVAIAPMRARADDPIEWGTPPPVPEPSCQCGPNGEWILCSLCSRDDAPAESGGTSSTPSQGVPPILKFAAGVVGGAVIAGMFAVAPAHTVSLFSKSKTAQEARDAWNDERDRLEHLEHVYGDAVDLGRDLDRAVRAAARPAAIGNGYAAVEVGAPPATWSSGGTCSQLVAANDRALATMDRRAQLEAREQFPTWADVVKRARQEVVNGVARAVGADKLLKQGKALQADYARAKEMDAFLKELTACQERKAIDPTSDCEQIIYARVNAELKVFMDELQAGAGDAQERVRKASQFYRSYVNDLQREVQKQALWATRCP